MKLSVCQLKQLLQLATEAALKAGDFINNVDRRSLQVHSKQAGSSLSAQVVTQVDLDSQAIILAILEPTIEQYDIALLTEENACEEDVATHARFHKDYFWCIDPLDGTLPFIEGGNGFAVSIALVDMAGKPIIGVVYNPSTNDLYQAINAQPLISSVLKNGLPWRADLPEQLEQPQPISSVLSLYIDRSFQQDPRYPTVIKQVTALAGQQGLELQVIKNCGAVMNAIGVLENPPACYVKLPKPQLGGGSLWDFSATAAITQALSTQYLASTLLNHDRQACCSVSDYHGAALDLNRSDSNYMNHKGMLYSCGLVHHVLILPGI
ncbi:3'(2'),5'-bisphosphate nucleotidase CysQ [Moritella sp. Urea-trap-13]|uniref:3'(2'),5'-bisphosphate nucleotidase CysQ family protein n=1 Tax=Moritella sp. Urea-trap-13 TaxID=2058327 RepID=UPI000C31F328|nr:inositol monophosphatase family protein [Moritella sp. Urea-trap-13]PKH07432.1 inositol-1-monophosphatase [Moritella sp. Urea-trap-13]